MTTAVLYADLAGFTARSHGADPEDVRAIQRPFHAGARREIEARGGSVEKFIGDAVVASFSEPQAAVETAWGVVAVVEELNARDDSLRLSVRVGVCSGDEQDGELPGELVEIASRLQSRAGANGVVVDEPTRVALEETFSASVLEDAAVFPSRLRPAPIYRVASRRSPALSLRAPVEEVREEEERKVVTVLFADLFDLAIISPTADPRDIRTTRRPSYARLKEEIERFGGTVEKFVGDALMAVFGAPVAREDDAERAVRAALRILHAVQEQNEDDLELELGVRASVNTGEVVVALGARPEEGEGIVTGDAVNTAARLLGVAPLNSVAVGRTTYEQTKEAFEYELLPPVVVKGIPELLQVYSALSATTEEPTASRPATAFVGRGPELALLKGTYARVVRERNLQMVVLSAEPGAGKTRVLAEFRRFVDDQLELVTWREGRSLPYGAGIAFWALGSIVKREAGILESDGAEEVSEKLVAVIRALTVDESERDWLVARLGPLVGTAVGSLDARVDRAESFAAWRRFVELIATSRPLVIALEDLHWASDPLLDFVEELADASLDVPVVVVATTRPDLYERRPEWCKRRENVTVARLAPLDAGETARLLADLLGADAIADATVRQLAARSGGNPLYAVEVVRMLREQNLLVQTDDGFRLANGAESALPASVQAVIAARLDALPRDRKGLLLDASVIGRTFWSGALGALDGGTSHDALADVVRRAFAEPAPVSSIEGDDEYSFSHALVCDVAYSQMPRATKWKKHRAAAAWLENVAGASVRDHAELLAHHYDRALALARAARAPEAQELEQPAARSFVRAGERAQALDLRSAQRYYERALDLLPRDQERAAVLVKLHEPVRHLEGSQDAVPYLEEAAELYRSVGNGLGEGEAAIFLARLFGIQGDERATRLLRDRALSLLEQEPPSDALVHGYLERAQDGLMDAVQDSLRWSDRALEVAQQIGARHLLPRVHALRGRARCYLGDAAGLQDLRDGARISLELGLGFEAVYAHNNLAIHAWLEDGPAEGLGIAEAAHELERKLGLEPPAGAAGELRMLYDLGRWDELLERATAQLRRGGPEDALVVERQAAVLLRRGALNDAAGLRDRLVDEEDPGWAGRAPGIATAAAVEQALGNGDAAVELLTRLTDARDTVGLRAWRAWVMPDALRVLVRTGALEAAERFFDRALGCDTRRRNCILHGRAILAEARSEDTAAALYEEAAEKWRVFPALYEYGDAVLGLCRCLARRSGDGLASLKEAEEVFRSIGAEPAAGEAASLRARQVSV